MKNLGVIFDSELIFIPHIKNIKSVFYRLKNIARVFSSSGQHGDADACFYHHIDYWKALLSGLWQICKFIKWHISGFGSRQIIIMLRLTASSTWQSIRLCFPLGLGKLGDTTGFSPELSHYKKHSDTRHKICHVNVPASPKHGSACASSYHPGLPTIYRGKYRSSNTENALLLCRITKQMFQFQSFFHKLSCVFNDRCSFWRQYPVVTVLGSITTPR